MDLTKGRDRRDSFFEADLRLTANHQGNSDSFLSRKAHSEALKVPPTLSLCHSALWETHPAQAANPQTRSNLQNKALLIFLWAEHIKSAEPCGNSAGSRFPSARWDNELEAVVLQAGTEGARTSARQRLAPSLKLLSCLVSVCLRVCASECTLQSFAQPGGRQHTNITTEGKRLKQTSTDGNQDSEVRQNATFSFWSKRVWDGS